MRNNDEIIEVLHSTMWRRDEAEEQRFLDAVDRIETPIARQTVKALFDTFLPMDDYGTQESVVAKLCLVPDDLYFDVLADEFSCLVERAPIWAEDVIAGAAKFKQPQLVEMLLRVDESLRTAVLSFMRERLADEPETKQVSQIVAGKVG